jgi:hypothetical protein
MDPELRAALDQFAGLRGEIVATREALDRLAADLRSEMRAGDAETREAVQAASVETRHHFDVVAESLRSDIRTLAESVALGGQRTDTRFTEHTERADRLEGRVLRLEVRVSSLEDDRRPRRRRRR